MPGSRTAQRMRVTRLASQISTATLLVTLSACGGGGGSGGGDSAYTINGSISGLSSSGLTLANDGKTLAIAAQAVLFSFPTSYSSGNSYAVSIQAQPSGETCSVSNGQGSITANVTNVMITCTVNTYDIGGSIAGLDAKGLVLANGADTAEPAANDAVFIFPTPVAFGTAYAVTVKQHPTGLDCTVANSTGTVQAGAVTTVAVTCSPALWTWVSGASMAGAVNGYTLPPTSGSSPPSGNAPSGRQGAVAWMDAGGNVWLFGGSAWYREDDTFSMTTLQGSGYANDLWKYDRTSGQWAWVSGSADWYATHAQTWTGVPTPRAGATSWTDVSGNFWLFGGHNGYGNSETVMGDLWKYSPTSGQWTALPVASGRPLARHDVVSWTDGHGNAWIFGGVGCDTTCQAGGASGQGWPVALNDLWRYDSVGTWTQVSGSNTASAGVYGTLGVASAANIPPGRYDSATWTDKAGSLWLFGGFSLATDSQGNVTTYHVYSDLWVFTPGTGLWTWMAGPDTPDAAGVYGTQRVAAAINIPAARGSGAAWTDSTGNFWLLGGASTTSLFNDLWSYSPATGQWTWVGGSSAANAPGVYGSLGIAASGNMPGARSGASAIADPSGALWLFGGNGYDSTGNLGLINDLWRFGQ